MTALVITGCFATGVCGFLWGFFCLHHEIQGGVKTFQDTFQALKTPPLGKKNAKMEKQNPNVLVSTVEPGLVVCLTVGWSSGF